MQTPTNTTTSSADQSGTKGDPVVQWALELGELHRQGEVIGRAIVQYKTDGTDATGLEEKRAAISDRIHVYEAIITGHKATSIEGALAQIMLASTEADWLACCPPNSDDNDYYQGRVDRLLYGARRALEAVVGKDRFGDLAQMYMPAGLDPFVIRDREIIDDSDGVLNRLTGALLDRLTHHVHILEMNGDSYRLNQSRRKQTARHS
jgi:hypothetical protein